MKSKFIFTIIFPVLIFLPTNYLLAQNTTEAPLISAVLYKNISEVEIVLDEGADINQKDEKGYTALIWACSYGSRDNYREAAKLLISKGANIDLQAKDGNAAIIEAAGNSPELFNLLLEKGANINVKKTDGSGALYNCLASIINYGREFTDDYMKIINYLLANGASADEAPNSGDLEGFTPLLFAARENKLKIAKLLIEHGADVNAKNVSGQTPLSQAKKAGHAEMIQLLKSNGAK